MESTNNTSKSTNNTSKSTNDDTYKDCIDIIKKSSSDIVKVANDIIDILNIKQKRIVITKEEIRINDFITECIHIVSTEANNKNILISFNIDKEIPQIIYSDKNRLAQIIINLLDNAIVHTHNGKIMIDVSLYNKNEKNCPFDYIKQKYPMLNILFSIKDTGIGIKKSKKKIINSIIGIRDDNIKSYKLSGFGLFISRHFCNLLGGNIWFKSKEEIGSIFSFNIICQGNY